MRLKLINCGLALLLVCAFFIAGGCKNLLGVIAAKTVGETVYPKYTPVKDQPMLVLAENYQNLAASSQDADQLARYVCQNLERKQVAPLIDPALAMDMRSKDPTGFRKMTITQVGETLGARQVLYISILNDAIEDATGAEFRRAEAVARVRIVDVQTGETRWPVEASEGYPVSSKTPVTKIVDENDEAELKRAVNMRLGGTIARLFYKYKTDEEGDKAFGQ